MTTKKIDQFVRHHKQMALLGKKKSLDHSPDYLIDLPGNIFYFVHNK